jgi:hypothetical protein
MAGEEGEFRRRSKSADRSAAGTLAAAISRHAIDTRSGRSRGQVRPADGLLRERDKPIGDDLER